MAIIIRRAFLFWTTGTSRHHLIPSQTIHVYEHAYAEALLKYETLDAAEIQLAITGREAEIGERHAALFANLTWVT